MSKAKSIRKSVLKRNKNIRRSQQGQPKARTKRRATFLMMKDFNKFVQRKMSEGVIVDHKDAGLPEEISLANFTSDEDGNLVFIGDRHIEEITDEVQDKENQDN